MAKNVIGSIENLEAQERELFIAKLQKWSQSAELLVSVKEEEIVLRKEIYAETIKPLAGLKEGTNKFTLYSGHQIDVQVKYNYRVDDKKFTSAIEAMAAAGIDHNTLVKWKPELSLSEYRKLSDAQKAIVDEFVTISEGTPQMKIEIPKR